jgi:hypothetical protein
MARRAATRFVVATTVVSSFTCGGAPRGVVDKCTDQLSLPPSVTTDFLFVIDNSISMGDEQAKVVARLSAFVDALSNAPVKNDFQIGVITTSVSLNSLDACPPATGTRLFPYSEQAGRLQLGTNLSGVTQPSSKRKLLSYQDPDLLEQFGLLIGQGVVGSGQEMPFEAMRLALSPPLIDTPLDAVPPGNRGLLRPGARLVVVMVSDEDDCSDATGTAVALQPGSCGAACTIDSECTADGSFCLIQPDTKQRSCSQDACETQAGRAALTPVSSYVDFLKNLDDGTGTGRKREVYLSVIGPVDDLGHPIRCHSATDEAYGAGVRHVQAVTSMGERGLIASICADDFGSALRQIAALVSEPQVVDLANDPVDGRLLVVEIERPGEHAADGGILVDGGIPAVDASHDGGGPTFTITCRVGDGFTFAHSTATTPARITMEGRCRLHFGDKVSVRLFCAE